MRAIRHAFRFSIVMLVTLFWPMTVMPLGAQDGRNMMAGQTLMTFCGTRYDTDVGLCNGYIMAVAEIMAAGTPVFGARACGHGFVRAQQLVDLVQMEIDERPELLNQPAGAMVATVLSAQFPCDGDAPPMQMGAVATPGPISPAMVMAEPLAPRL